MESEWGEWLSSHAWMIRSVRPDMTHQDFAWQPLGQWTYKTPGTTGFHGLSPRIEQCQWNVIYQMTIWATAILCEIPTPVQWHSSFGNWGMAEVDAARIVAVGTDIPVEAYRRLGWAVIEHNDVIGRNKMSLCRCGNVSVLPKTEGVKICNEGAVITARKVSRIEWIVRGGTVHITEQKGGSILLLGGNAYLTKCESVQLSSHGCIQIEAGLVDGPNGDICLSNRTI